MSATRLLILGVVRMLQPVHGYEVRRELTAWQAQQWANIAYGSIYFALKKLTADRLIEPADATDPERRPVRTRYRVTPEGEAEFHRLLHETWWHLRPVVDPFMVALSFVDELPREEVVAGLRFRADAARGVRETMDIAIDSPLTATKPGHVGEMFRLLAARAGADAQWADELIAKVRPPHLP